MRIRRVGRRALLLECADGTEVELWRAELWRRREAGQLPVEEIVPGAATVLIDGVGDPLATIELISRWSPQPAAADQPVETVDVPTVYDGVDLPDVAQLWGVTVPTAVDRLRSAQLRVAFCGFAPGFAYLTGLPAQWAVPRLTSPRPRVPAGAVALAGPYAGIYPTASPGGWRLVGRTNLVLFDVHRDPPARLAPGTTVRLVET